MKKILTKNAMLLLLLTVVFATSCNSYKKVPYLQNSGNLKTYAGNSAISEPVIMPYDMLTITVVSTQDLKAAMSFNLIMPSDNSTVKTLTTQPALQHYVVDSKGCVNIPNVGEVHIAGKTISEAEELVLSKVESAFAVPPTVTVRFVDYKISVLGEVTAPGTYTIKNGKVNILQALSLARDLTIYGERSNVKIVRENADGAQNVYEIDLNDAALLNSPYYYLQQNDIVYVTPNKAKSKNSDIGSSTSLWFSGTSVAISLITFDFAEDFSMVLKRVFILKLILVVSFKRSAWV